MRRVVAVVVVLVLAAGGCVGSRADDSLPERVNALPAGVTGLGPAVFLTRTPDESRTDILGLRAVARFGDDIAGVAPVRQHVRLAQGNPTLPTVARWPGDERRSAFLSGGRVFDVTLPDSVHPDRVFPLSATVTATGTGCLTIGPDRRIIRPAGICELARDGGAYWAEGASSRFGGIDLASGAPSKAVRLPEYPTAVSSDGRYLAAKESGSLVIADTATGAVRTTVPAFARGVFAEGAFVAVHLVRGLRALSLISPAGAVRTLVRPVGDVSLARDGRYAVATAGARLLVVDLPSGKVRPIIGGPTDLGRVTATFAGDYALIAEVDEDPDLGTPSPTRVWSSDLAIAQLRSVKATPAATGVAGMDANSPAGLRFSPGGEVFTLTAGGDVTRAPAHAQPRLALTRGRMLYERNDALLMADIYGRRTELLDVGDDQRLGEIVATPDGRHIVVSLRDGGSGRTSLGPRDQIVLVRLDRSTDPLVLYRSAVLASIGLLD
ncbi:hypothetical protein [Cryptosporangium minutisporangium]|uniref:hypothetical protein n=1 Tax=Cryptosporangium minutisporangium TaxID=113569 RepID=UPI0031EB43BB